MYNELEYLLDQQLNEYLSMDNDNDVYGFVSDIYCGDIEENSDYDDSSVKVDFLRNKLFNQLVDLLVLMDIDKVELSERQNNKYLRLSEYFNKFPQEQKTYWIDFPIN